MNRRSLFRRLATIAAGAAAACVLPVARAGAVVDLPIRPPVHRMLAWTQGASGVWDYAPDLTPMERAYVDGVRAHRIAPSVDFETWQSARAFADEVNAHGGYAAMPDAPDLYAVTPTNDPPLDVESWLQGYDAGWEAADAAGAVRPDL